MCSMMPPITHVVAVADGVDVDLDRVVQEPVEQHRRIVRHLHRLAHVALEVALLVHDLHRAAAEHVRRAHHHRIADLLAPPRSPRPRCARCRWAAAAARAGAASAGSARGPRRVDHVGRRADDRHAVRLEVARELERRLAAELHDHARTASRRATISSTSSSVSGSKYSRSRGVVVGRHGLRVAVDHDGLEAVFAQRQRRVHAAVVELDALADAVRAAAEDDHLLAVGRARLALVLVRRVHVRRCASRTRRRRCRRACRPAGCRARGGARAPRASVVFEQVREAAVGEADALQLAQLVARRDRSSVRFSSSSSMSTISLICARNHGSIFV